MPGTSGQDWKYHRVISDSAENLAREFDLVKIHLAANSIKYQLRLDDVNSDDIAHDIIGVINDQFYWNTPDFRRRHYGTV